MQDLEPEFTEFGLPEFTEHYVVSPPSSGCMDIHWGTLALKNFYSTCCHPHLGKPNWPVLQFDGRSCCFSVQSGSFQAPFTQPEAQSFPQSGCVYSLPLVLESVLALDPSERVSLLFPESMNSETVSMGTSFIQSTRAVRDTL